jgi:hypothetical protein
VFIFAFDPERNIRHNSANYMPSVCQQGDFLVRLNVIQQTNRHRRQRKRSATDCRRHSFWFPLHSRQNSLPCAIKFSSSSVSRCEAPRHIEFTWWTSRTRHCTLHPFSCCLLRRRRACWHACLSRVGSTPDDKSFYDVANRRGGCTMMPFSRTPTQC